MQVPLPVGVTQAGSLVGGGEPMPLQASQQALPGYVMSSASQPNAGSVGGTLNHAASQPTHNAAVPLALATPMALGQSQAQAPVQAQGSLGHGHAPFPNQAPVPFCDQTFSSASGAVYGAAVGSGAASGTCAASGCGDASGAASSAALEGIECSTSFAAAAAARAAAAEEEGFGRSDMSSLAQEGLLILENGIVLTVQE